MTLIAQNNPICITDRPQAMPVAALESVAARFRPAGLFLLAFDRDGALAWHDRSAGLFFLRYVLPIIQQSQAGTLDHKCPDSVAAFGVLAGADTMHRAPGVHLAILPFTDRRHDMGFLVVAARDEALSRNNAFARCEDALRLCSRLGLDAGWLATQAGELPAFSPALLQRQAPLVGSCLRDQLRLRELEQDLNNSSEQLAASYEELSLIYQVSSGMKVNRSAADFFKQTCTDVLRVMGLSGAGVALQADADSAKPAFFGTLALPEQAIARLAQELMALLPRRKVPVLINNVAADANFRWLGAHARRLLAVPLQRYEKTLGCFFALDKEAADFDSADAKLLSSIANESAIYLENARLFEDAHGLMMGLLHSLTSAVDAKDTYTCGHSERVALLSRHLSQEFRLADFDIEHVYMAGLLHDVGKIGVPEAVLQKTGKLTAEEFELMKKHPRIGARILQDVPQVKHLIPGVLHHHERFDGKGYPGGLAGKDIPLMGRIICLADSFDAMTSNRTYRKGLPPEVALAEIRRCSGTHFDPELAEAFLATSADRYRDLLRDHQEKSRRLLDYR